MLLLCATATDAAAWSETPPHAEKLGGCVVTPGYYGGPGYDDRGYYDRGYYYGDGRYRDYRDHGQ
ncbi:MAG TPA: hypothetical protein VEN29_14735 [Casimicrobiaceae bacterium]|nr:hypothetical protein [Casimicrobiaceae bacterium]